MARACAGGLNCWTAVRRLGAVASQENKALCRPTEGSMAPPSPAAAAAASVAAATEAAVADIAAREAAAQADRDAQAAFLAAQAARADSNAERPYPGPFENLHREARGTHAVGLLPRPRTPLRARARVCVCVCATPCGSRADMGRPGVVRGRDC